MRLLRQGRLIPVPPPEKALRYLASEGVRPPASSSHRARRGIIGSPETVRSGLEELAEDYGADELMVVTITYDHDARRRSYELIAEAFGAAVTQPLSRSASMPPIVPRYALPSGRAPGRRSCCCRSGAGRG